jgi:hypothetical protein
MDEIEPERLKIAKELDVHMQSLTFADPKAKATFDKSESSPRGY